MCHDRVVRLAVAAALTLSTLSSWACTSSSTRWADGQRDTPAPRGALLTVENQHVQDMRVYLVRASTPIALGSVGTMERRTFAIPTAVLVNTGGIRLMAAHLGSRGAYTSDFISAIPGDHVRWTLAPSLSLSRFTVRHVVGGF